MSLDVGYSYCTNLREQEKLDIDKQVKTNRLELRFAIFFTFPIFPRPMTPFFPVEGFTPQQIVIQIVIDEFQQEVSDPSSNEILSEHNLNETYKAILVKNDGVLPGADGFNLNNNFGRRHPMGIPRIRRQLDVQPQNIPRFDNLPKAPKIRSFKEVDTGLNGKPGNRGDQCPAHQTQVSGFVKNGKVDLRKCYDEVIRRSNSLHCENWSCDFERFKSLAMENGRVDENSAGEAITVLNGEMLGFYRNAEREYYGKGVYGPDFKVIGQGEYSHVTHIEVKNPVGSDIEKASRNGYSDIVKQGNKIGDKVSKQQSKWSNATFRGSLSNLDPNAAFPQIPANILGLVDEFDVPISEKMIVQNAVENNCTNTSNVIFINNETNI